ncbi:hypothetical protein PGT21_016689 [Puccinia graminis f. sp. tritici]|uniref:Uncharacterized protein n=1 Tax=Puccinia graminis f. sp. tritici TaxID=56615 RepID=A0A5B0S2G4_PUCGR|nr:hypothetical protein PGT21_016689 [Puccinia graminis f. sp. tritici]KAA1132002.1 hypothetical protein PGTUg99_035517 [Puccinia graminis f. sp. tritici]
MKRFKNMPDSADEEGEDLNKTNFRIFAPDKAKTKSQGGIKSRVWITVANPKPMVISITVAPPAEATQFADFQDIVMTACEEAVKNSRGMISDSLACDTPLIQWTAFIPRVDGFKKDDGFVLVDEDAYSEWIKTLAAVGNGVASLSLEMDDPRAEVKRAHQSSVLARLAIRKDAKETVEAANRLKASNVKPTTDLTLFDEGSDDDVEEEIDADDVKLLIRKLYKHHPHDPSYDTLIPVYIDPGNRERFIILTYHACKEWARAILKPTAGVTIDSPPSSLKFETRASSSKRKRGSKSGVAHQGKGGHPHHGHHGHNGSHCCSHHQGYPSSVTSEGTPAPDDTDMRQYVKFIGFRNQENVIELLVNNDMTSYKIFKSRNLDRSLLLGLGLTVGVVTQLFDNVSRFERKLAKNKK